MWNKNDTCYNEGAEMDENKKKKNTIDTTINKYYIIIRRFNIIIGQLNYSITTTT